MTFRQRYVPYPHALRYVYADHESKRSTHYWSARMPNVYNQRVSDYLIKQTYCVDLLVVFLAVILTTMVTAGGFSHRRPPIQPTSGLGDLFIAESKDCATAAWPAQSSMHAAPLQRASLKQKLLRKRLARRPQKHINLTAPSSP